MLVRRLRRWPNIRPNLTMGQRFLGKNSQYCSCHLRGQCLPCNAKRRYQLTLQVSRYRLLTLQSRVLCMPTPRFSMACRLAWVPMRRWLTIEENVKCAKIGMRGNHRRSIPPSVLVRQSWSALGWGVLCRSAGQPGPSAQSPALVCCNCYCDWVCSSSLPLQGDGLLRLYCCSAKQKRRYLLTCKVIRYCLLASHVCTAAWLFGLHL